MRSQLCWCGPGMGFMCMLMRGHPCIVCARAGTLVMLLAGSLYVNMADA